MVANDIHVTGFGVRWGHVRSFASKNAVAEDCGNGWNWPVAVGGSRSGCGCPGKFDSSGNPTAWIVLKGEPIKFTGTESP